MTGASVSNMAGSLGQQIRSLRLRRNLNQQELASQAGVALNALKGLESGRGGTVRSLLKVVRALDRDDWWQTLSPAVSISPLQLLERKQTRLRASRKRLGNL